MIYTKLEEDGETLKQPITTGEAERTVNEGILNCQRKDGVFK